MTVQDIITEIRDLLVEASANFWSDAQMLRAVNRRTQYYMNVLRNNAPGPLFVRTANISYVANQELYDLPGNVLQIHRVARDDQSGDPEITPIGFHERDAYYGTGVGIHTTATERWYLLGDQIGIVPPPSSGITNALKIYYEPLFGDVHYGTAAAGAATTITLATTPTVGTAPVRDDYYNGLTIEIVSATGAGQRRVITDYVGSTRVATVDTWDTNPDNTSVYSLIPPFPEQYHGLLVIASAISLASLQDPSAPIPAEWRDEQQQMETAVLNSISPRQAAQPRYVNYTGEDQWL